ncbi:MAG: NAD(P)-binding domain-containing protein, partial [bacterium]|nr:NAD(P)-binding domain-containing protein [bacterium]MDW8163460.1 NAD(P)-binding domain-containing protein [Candidatus Omnitrophota bacterium]
MGEKIGIIGSGGWGIALAILLNKLNHKIYLWEPFKENFKILSKLRENITYFKGVKIPKEVEITNSLEEVFNNVGILIIVVRSSFFRKTIKKIKEFYKNQVIIIGTKGLEFNTGKRMSEIFSEYIKTNNFAVLSGPTIA